MTSIAPSWARVGVKVVRARSFPNASPIPPEARTTNPKLGEIVTIRSVEPHPGSGILALRFVEHVNPSIYYDGCGLYEVQFSIRCYEPLVSRTQQQDAAMFRQLVDELPILERAMLYEEVLNDMWSR